MQHGNGFLHVALSNGVLEEHQLRLARDALDCLQEGIPEARLQLREDLLQFGGHTFSSTLCITSTPPGAVEVTDMTACETPRTSIISPISGAT